MIVTAGDNPLELRGQLDDFGQFPLSYSDRKYGPALECACEGWVMRRLVDDNWLGRPILLKDHEPDLTEMTKAAQHYAKEFSHDLRWETPFDVTLTWNHGCNSTNIRCQIRKDGE